jgi:hypothetical protein
MARPRSYGTDDFAIGQMPPVDLSQNREGDEIIPVDINLSHENYLAELKFMEDPVTISISRSTEASGQYPISISCNGETIWIPVGIPTIVKRKFVEILANSKTTNVATETEMGQRDVNLIHRNTHSRFPFTVIRDDNPRGYDWLTKILAS